MNSSIMCSRQQMLYSFIFDCDFEVFNVRTFNLSNDW